jgi:hypothetical protein
MKNIILILNGIILSATTSLALTNNELNFKNAMNNYEFAVSVNGNASALALSCNHLHTVASNKQEAKPINLNALLISDNDIGSLNSEIKIKYYFKPNWAINFGGTFIFAEYTTANKLFKDNDRFRQKTFMPMIGICYTPFKN